MSVLKIAVVAVIAVMLASCSLFNQKTPAKSYYFRDTVDNGNDAGTAGCHVEYLTSACNNRQVVGVTGDSCLSEQSINEYTNNRTCHRHDNRTSPADISAINCSEYCGSRGGHCETVDNACNVRGITSNSARCVCNE